MLGQFPTGIMLAELRRACDLTQRDLAAKAGLHVNSIKRLERLTQIPASSWYGLGQVTAVLRDSGANLPATWATENRAVETAGAILLANIEDKSRVGVLPQFLATSTKPHCRANVPSGQCQHNSLRTGAYQ